MGAEKEHQAVMTSQEGAGLPREEPGQQSAAQQQQVVPGDQDWHRQRGRALIVPVMEEVGGKSCGGQLRHPLKVFVSVRAKV